MMVVTVISGIRGLKPAAKLGENRRVMHSLAHVLRHDDRTGDFRRRDFAEGLPLLGFSRRWRDRSWRKRKSHNPL
jgi:hypothetical protein